jgi:methylenetetrahydrofolate dehydrogenase (NADP+)/methenyltetrahydrofolate cyclohydrolase
MAMIIDGKAISNQIKSELKEYMKKKSNIWIKKTLAIIQIGNNPASDVYVRNKIKVCGDLGIISIFYKYSTIETDELVRLIETLNQSVNVDGILVQLPLPKNVDQKIVLNAINPRKDVDGFHLENIGKLAVGEKGFRPATPAGIIELLKRSGIQIEGKECVVIGRSNIVGKPIAQLLLAENGTVTIAHSHTANLKEVAKRADILIVAVGKERMITADYVKPGAVVIDVGINRDENNHLCGDVDFENVKDVAGYITPVPGGVGPMTIAMLMKNVIMGASK